MPSWKSSCLQCIAGAARLKHPCSEEVALSPPLHEGMAVAGGGAGTFGKFSSSLSLLPVQCPERPCSSSGFSWLLPPFTQPSHSLTGNRVTGLVVSLIRVIGFSTVQFKAAAPAAVVFLLQCRLVRWRKGGVWGRPGPLSGEASCGVLERRGLKALAVSIPALPFLAFPPPGSPPSVASLC